MTGNGNRIRSVGGVTRRECRLVANLSFSRCPACPVVLSSRVQNIVRGSEAGPVDGALHWMQGRVGQPCFQVSGFGCRVETHLYAVPASSPASLARSRCAPAHHPTLFRYGSGCGFRYGSGCGTDLAAVAQLERRRGGRERGSAGWWWTVPYSLDSGTQAGRERERESV